MEQGESVAELTPREREVLELVRIGLTNEEIAGRLGISLAGARYHVSEIIGKLGVQNRYEAAAWPDRPPWWATRLSALTLFWRRTALSLPAKLSRVTLALVLTLLAIALGGAGLIAFLLLRGDESGQTGNSPAEAAVCPSRDPPQFDGDDDLTLEEVANRFEETATCPGYVLQLRTAGESEAGPYTSHSEISVWIDLRDKRGRVEQTFVFTSEEARQAAREAGEPLTERRGASVHIDGWEYWRQYYGDEQNHFGKEQKSDSCHGADRGLLELALGCELVEQGPTEELTFDIEQQTTYRGKEALAFVKSGVSRGSDETYDTTTRLFVDRRTFLPLGTTGEGTLDIGEVFPVSSDIPYEHSFVRADTLPADHFDPASLGYVIDGFEPAIRGSQGDLPVYWLGTERGGQGGLPSLVLDSVYVFGMATPPDVERPYPALQLNYRLANEPDAEPSVEVRIYKEADWLAYEENGAGTAAVIDFHGREARLGFWAEAASLYIDGTVVNIRAPQQYGDGQTPTVSPYDSRVALDDLARSLTLFE